MAAIPGMEKGEPREGDAPPGAWDREAAGEDVEAAQFGPDGHDSTAGMAVVIILGETNGEELMDCSMQWNAAAIDTPCVSRHGRNDTRSQSSSDRQGWHGPNRRAV